MNQNQLNYIATNPQVQLLIDAFKLEDVTTPEAHKINQNISARVSQWFQEFSQPPKPKVIEPEGCFKTQEQIQAYITQYQAQHGRNSCPF